MEVTRVPVQEMQLLGYPNKAATYDQTMKIFAVENSSQNAHELRKVYPKVRIKVKHSLRLICVVVDNLRQIRHLQYRSYPLVFGWKSGKNALSPLFRALFKLSAF